MSDRCSRHQDIVPRVFFITSNPSVGWGATAPEFTAETDSIKVEAVCPSCLTKDELIKILAPAALYVMEALQPGLTRAQLYVALLYTADYHGDLEHRARLLLT